MRDVFCTVARRLYMPARAPPFADLDGPAFYLRMFTVGLEFALSPMLTDIWEDGAILQAPPRDADAPALPPGDLALCPPFGHFPLVCPALVVLIWTVAHQEDGGASGSLSLPTTTR